MPPTPNDSDTPLPSPSAMEQGALQWFSRCQQGLSEHEENAFAAWLAADPRHAALFNELDGTWSLLDRVAQSTPVLLPDAPRRTQWHRLGAWSAVAAAAAIVVLGYFRWWQPNHFTGELSTAVGAIRAQRLPDGSEARLNTNSLIRAHYRPEERRIALARGEVHFLVAKDASRPFVVEADGLIVRAVGTAFNVHLGATTVEVLVTAGSVQVQETGSGAASPTAPMLILVAGEKLVLPRSVPSQARAVVFAEKPASRVSPEEIQRALAWQQDRLVFELAPLAEIVAAFNRHNQRPLVVADPALAAQRFGGSFRPGDPAGLVRMLQQNFGVLVEEQPHATVLRAAP